MVLSDNEIWTQLIGNMQQRLIDPFNMEQLQPASYDVQLDSKFRVFRSHSLPFIKTWERGNDVMELVDLGDQSPEDRIFILHPGQFALASTVERVHIPDDLVGRVEGKSSLGRQGLLVHATAGFLDPGFEGYITLEMFCVASVPVAVRPGQRIAQVAFERLSSPAGRPYGHPSLNSHYQHQGAEPVQA